MLEQDPNWRLHSLMLQTFHPCRRSRRLLMLAKMTTSRDIPKHLVLHLLLEKGFHHLANLPFGRQVSLLVRWTLSLACVWRCRFRIFHIHGYSLIRPPFHSLVFSVI